MRSLLLLVLLSWPLASASQSFPKLGKVTPSSFTWNGEGPRPVAVVLGDIGESTIVGQENTITSTSYSRAKFSNRLVFRRETRILVLEKAGAHHADLVIPQSEIGYQTEVRIADARTYRMAGKSVEVTKLSISGSIEAKDDTFRFQFRAQPGDIVEYTVIAEITNFAKHPTWAFQREIPTLVSAFRLNTPSSYRVYYKGQELNARYLQPTNVWVLSNLPAVVQEPYSLAAPDRANLLYLQYNDIMELGKNLAVENSENGVTRESVAMLNQSVGVTSNMQQVSTSGKGTLGWEDQMRLLGTALYRSPFIYPFVKREGVVAGSDAAVSAIYAASVKATTWNHKFTSFPHRTQQKMQPGNLYSSEVNLFLIQRLRESGIKAYPVLVSTRKHGSAPTNECFISWYDHLIVGYEDASSQWQFVDATDPNRPSHLLNPEIAGSSGYLIHPTDSRHVPITKPVPSNTKLDTRVVLQPKQYMLTTNYTATGEAAASIQSAMVAKDTSSLLSRISAGKLVYQRSPRVWQTTANRFTVQAIATTDGTYPTQVVSIPLRDLVPPPHLFVLDSNRVNAIVTRPQSQDITLEIVPPSGYLPKNLPQAIQMNAGTMLRYRIDVQPGSVQGGIRLIIKHVFGEGSAEASAAVQLADLSKRIQAYLNTPIVYEPGS